MDANRGPVNREPTNLELRELERIVDRRAELEAAGGDERRAALRRLLLETLDQMEEALCLYGRRAPALADGWRRLAHLERPGGAGREPRTTSEEQTPGRRSGGQKPAAAATVRRHDAGPRRRPRERSDV